MTTLQDIKAGDKVILIKRDGQREVRTVKATTSGLVDISLLKTAWNFERETGESFRGGGDRILPATAKLIAEVTAEDDARKRKEQKAKADKQADPRTPLISRFRNSEFEKWEKLSLAQLQQIAAWLDS